MLLFLISLSAINSYHLLPYSSIFISIFTLWWILFIFVIVLIYHCHLYYHSGSVYCRQKLWKQSAVYGSKCQRRFQSAEALSVPTAEGAPKVFDVARMFVKCLLYLMTLYSFVFLFKYIYILNTSLSGKFYCFFFFRRFTLKRFNQLCPRSLS